MRTKCELDPLSELLSLYLWPSWQVPDKPCVVQVLDDLAETCSDPVERPIDAHRLSFWPQPTGYGTKRIRPARKPGSVNDISSHRFPDPPDPPSPMPPRQVPEWHLFADRSRGRNRLTRHLPGVKGSVSPSGGAFPSRELSG